MLWFSEQLGVSNPEMWYKMQADGNKHARRGFLCKYNYRIIDALMELFPDYHWKLWKFTLPTIDYWLVSENCQEYLQWLAGLHFPTSIANYFLRRIEIKSRR
jgi:hypothetical protein